MANPTALGLVVVCLLFPFMSVSCSTEKLHGVPEQEHQQWRVTYSGLDILAGGRPEVAVPATRRAAVVAGLALTAALALYTATLLAREQATDTVADVLRHATSTSASPVSTPIREWEYRPWVRDQFQFRYGFWVAIGTLVLLGLANVVRAVPGRTRCPRRPMPGTKRPTDLA